MATAADRDELFQKLVTDMFVGQVMDLGRLCFPAAFAETASAL
jgi:hypothetical protein